MKKLLRPTTFALLTMALCFTACENGNNSYPKEYLGFEKKAQDFSYQKNAEETELQVKIVAADKTSEDRIVSSSRPHGQRSPEALRHRFIKLKIIKSPSRAAANLPKPQSWFIPGKWERMNTFSLSAGLRTESRKRPRCLSGW